MKISALPKSAIFCTEVALFLPGVYHTEYLSRVSKGYFIEHGGTVMTTNNGIKKGNFPFSKYSCFVTFLQSVFYIERYIFAKNSLSKSALYEEFLRTFNQNFRKILPYIGDALYKEPGSVQ